MLTLKKFPREMLVCLRKLKLILERRKKHYYCSIQNFFAAYFPKFILKKLYGVWVVYYIFLLHVFPVGLVLIEN